MSKILERIDLTGIESWMEQQQYLVQKLLEEYQHLFALNLKELGRTSLVQHEIKLNNVEADALSCIPWESMQMKNVEPLIVKTMLQSKMESEINFPEEHFLEKVLLKSMTVDATLKLTQKDWVKNKWMMLISIK